MSLIVHSCVSASARHRGVGVGAAGGAKVGGGARDGGAIRATTEWDEWEVQNRDECAQGFIGRGVYRFDPFAQKRDSV